MKVALIQDQLLTCAGSERVFLYLAEEFAEADLFTLAYNPETTWPELKRFKFHTSVLGPIVRSHRIFQLLFPLATYVMQWWDFRRYDAVITSSATVAKYVRRFRGPHLCYCYFPTRAIWDSGSYFSAKAGIAAAAFKALSGYFKRRDLRAAQGVTRFIAISEVTRRAIRHHYGRESTVIASPIDFERFAPQSGRVKGGFYLLVSRLQTWKAIDYAVEAFNRIKRPLKIVGTGPDRQRLENMASSNIEFLGHVDDARLAELYGEAIAVVFTPVLEYGLVPLEANAAGTPCIAYGRGGVLETMIGLGDAAGRQPTSVLFDEQTPESLAAAVIACENTHFDRVALTAHASQYDVSTFKRRVRAMFDETVGNVAVLSIAASAA